MWLSSLKGCTFRILIFFSLKWNTGKSIEMDLKTVQHSYAEARVPCRQTLEKNLSWVCFSKWVWNECWKNIRNLRLKWTNSHALILPISVVLGSEIIGSKSTVPEISLHFLLSACTLFKSICEACFFLFAFFFFFLMSLFLLLHFSLNINLIPLCEFKTCLRHREQQSEKDSLLVKYATVFLGW